MYNSNGIISKAIWTVNLQLGINHVCLLVQSDSLARGSKHFGKSIPEFGEMHSSVLGCERKPVSASIISRSCFASFPVCVYKFSSHYLNNIIFIDNSLRPLATESLCIKYIYNTTRNSPHNYRCKYIVNLCHKDII
jgi:hypothetical protein